jgi:GTP cyclohydrolase II
MANMMLRHKADERGYEIAGAILRDLALDSGIKLLTNNPDKVRALQKEGLKVVERIPIVSRSWRLGRIGEDGEDLKKYLMTKITRMSHLLPLRFED